jgi:uncharacterized protein YbaP (TraB family)
VPGKLPCLAVLAVLLSIGTVSKAHSQSSVWKIEIDDHQLFLGGTVHVLSAADYPLPKEFDQAYNSSHTVILEANIEQLKSQEFQQQVLSQMIYTDGTNLRNLLSDETYAKLEAFCAKRGIPASSLTMFKPGMVSMTLTLLELQRLGLMGAGVDAHFSARAKKDGKRLGMLETVEQQLSFLVAMGQGREDELINYTLRDIGKLQELLDSIKAAWRTGDLDALDHTTLEPLKEEFPELYRVLLVSRNETWLPMIEAMLYSDPVELVLVGALHLVGDQGLLQQLTDRGYSVSRVQ